MAKKASKRSIKRFWRKLFPSISPSDRTQLLEILNTAQRHDIMPVDTLSMMKGALGVADMHVRDVMVPRAQMVMLPYNSGLEDLIALITESGHSRFPVISDNRDDVQGILLAKDLLQHCGTSDMQFNIRDLLRPAVFIPESKRLNVLLREFRTSRNHMAIVVDEYGGVAGLVTIEDVIEEIVGDIDDEHDLESATYIKPRGNNRYSVRALTPVDIFNEYFGKDFNDSEFDTIGGILLKLFGHLPKRGEELVEHGLRFEVLRSDSRRIHVLRVERLDVTEDTTDKEAEESAP
jgi:magnesium and cobalt transporter